MNYNTQLVIQKELDADEKLLWAGMPKQGIIFKGSDAFMIPFSLLWGGFAIFWEVMALQITNEKAGVLDLFFPLFGIPFVLVGLYMIFGRFIYDSKKRAQTFYGITNQRTIIISGLFNKHVKSINLKTMSDASLSAKTNGYGTINFCQENQMISMFMADVFPNMEGLAVPKFELIENAKQVYKQLKAQLRKQHQS